MNSDCRGGFWPSHDHMTCQAPDITVAQFSGKWQEEANPDRPKSLF